MIIHVYGLTPQGEVQHVLLVHLYNLAPQSVTVTHRSLLPPPTPPSAVVYSPLKKKACRSMHPFQERTLRDASCSGLSETVTR